MSFAKGLLYWTVFVGILVNVLTQLLHFLGDLVVNLFCSASCNEILEEFISSVPGRLFRGWVFGTILGSLVWFGLYVKRKMNRN